MIDEEAKAYTGEFREREFKGLKDSEVFFVLATKDCVTGILTPGHYLARQARVAIVLQKPVFIAWEKSVSEEWRRRVRAFFPNVDREMELRRVTKKAFGGSLSLWVHSWLQDIPASRSDCRGSTRLKDRSRG